MPDLTPDLAELRRLLDAAAELAAAREADA